MLFLRQIVVTWTEHALFCFVCSNLFTLQRKSPEELGRHQGRMSKCLLGSFEWIEWQSASQWEMRLLEYAFWFKGHFQAFQAIVSCIPVCPARCYPEDTGRYLHIMKGIFYCFVLLIPFIGIFSLLRDGSIIINEKTDRWHMFQRNKRLCFLDRITGTRLSFPP